MILRKTESSSCKTSNYTAKMHRSQQARLYLATDLLSTSQYQDASHGLRQLVNDKSVASCQQTCCKLIVKTCLPQVCCKLFHQVVVSLQMAS